MKNLNFLPNPDAFQNQSQSRNFFAANQKTNEKPKKFLNIQIIFELI